MEKNIHRRTKFFEVCVYAPCVSHAGYTMSPSLHPTLSSHSSPSLDLPYLHPTPFSCPPSHNPSPPFLSSPFPLTPVYGVGSPHVQSRSPRWLAAHVWAHCSLCRQVELVSASPSPSAGLALHPALVLHPPTLEEQTRIIIIQLLDKFDDPLPDG